MYASPRTSHHGESSTSHKRMKTKPVVLCAHCGYKASFEACFVDALRNTNFQQHCWKTAEIITTWCDSPSILIRLLHQAFL